MKAKDLRERTLDDLKELEKSLTGEKFQGRFKNFTNRLDDTSVIKKTRRELARVKTLLLEKVSGTGSPPKVEAEKLVAPKKKLAAPKAAAAAKAEKPKTTKPKASKAAAKDTK